MDVKKVRVERLRELLRNHGGKKVTLAHALKKAPAQVSQWLNGVRGISEDTAREIERAARLPTGWMDQPVGGLSSEPEPVYHAQKDDVALSDVLKHGTADDRRRVLDDIRMQLVRARAKYTNEEFSRYLDALDALDQPTLPSHERRRPS